MELGPGSEGVAMLIAAYSNSLWSGQAITGDLEEGSG